MDEHEIASSVLAAVDQAAYKNRASRIARIHLAIGARRVFDLERLNSVFSEVSRDTVAEGVRLLVDVLPIVHHCQNCGFRFEADAAESACPECNHPHTETFGGDELRLLDMEVEDAA